MTAVPMRPRRMRFPGAAIVCVILIVSTGGCARSFTQAPAPPSAGPASKAVMVIAVDRSVTGSAVRDTQVMQLNSLTKSAGESGYLLDLWTYDSSGAAHLWGPGVLSDPGQIDAIAGTDLAPVKSAARRPGRPETVIDAVSREQSLAIVPNGRILFLTDGALPADDPPRNFAKSVATIAARPHWRVEALDIAPGNAPTWKQALAQSLGNRYQIVSERDATNVLRQNHDE